MKKYVVQFFDEVPKRRNTTGRSGDFYVRRWSVYFHGKPMSVNLWEDRGGLEEGPGDKFRPGLVLKEHCPQHQFCKAEISTGCG